MINLRAGSKVGRGRHFGCLTINMLGLNVCDLAAALCFVMCVRPAGV